MVRRVVTIALGVFAVFVVVLLARPVRKTERSVPEGADVDTGPESHDDTLAPARTETPEPVLGTVVGELPATLINPEIVISKSLRTLTVMSEGARVKTYRIALGRDPIADKLKEGDGRTPEGDFYVCGRHSETRYHRTLGLSYPNEEDAERGSAAGIISRREYTDIVRAIRAMKRPPWHTGLGGEIMIHGGGTADDWTDGCIAMSDADAEELFAATPLGTPVCIEP
ncbi:MAG: L,D-transpeptidase [Actinomycetota bacterium]|nr:L,D-transpeptidase [Actinomycetota bacterium]